MPCSFSATTDGIKKPASMVPRRALPTCARATARRPDFFETDPRSRLSRGVTSERHESERLEHTRRWPKDLSPGSTPSIRVCTRFPASTRAPISSAFPRPTAASPPRWPSASWRRWTCSVPPRDSTRARRTPSRRRRRDATPAPTRRRRVKSRSPSTRKGPTLERPRPLMCPPRCVFLLSTTHVHKIFHPSARIGDFGAPRARTPAAPSSTNRLTSFRFLPTPPGFLPRQLRRRRRRGDVLLQGAYPHPRTYPSLRPIRADVPVSPRSRSPEPPRNSENTSLRFFRGCPRDNVVADLVPSDPPRAGTAPHTLRAHLRRAPERYEPERERGTCARSPDRPESPACPAPACPGATLAPPASAKGHPVSFQVQHAPSSTKKNIREDASYFEFYGYGR